jgi:hypothetical protein
MSESFRWGEKGLDNARFQAFAKILRIRNGGQVEPPTSYDNIRDEDEDEDMKIDADDNSTKTQTLTDFDDKRLRRSFLDRIAELVANIKGGRHVTAALMVESPEEVQVFVAKNQGVEENEIAFLKELETRLRSIARVNRKFF